MDANTKMINEKDANTKMTREEAVARIKDHVEIHRCHERNAVKIFEALDMAIKALEQPEPCEDTISRQAAIAVADYADYTGLAIEDVKKVTGEVVKGLKQLPSAQLDRQHGRIFQEIVVEYPLYSTYLEYEGKPYFSIKYTENGQGFIGYGTYKPEVLSEYLKEYFMPSVQPEPYREEGGE